MRVIRGTLNRKSQVGFLKKGEYPLRYFAFFISIILVINRCGNPITHNNCLIRHKIERDGYIWKREIADA